MFELIFLGTSASAPSARRNLPALVVKHDEFRFLVDCGEGTQRQILQSGIGFKNLNHILITHGHLDHILGLAGLLSTMLRWEAMDKLVIYGGRQSLERIHDLLYGVVLRGANTPAPVELMPIQEGIFFESGDLSISAFPVIHRGSDSFGYIFEEKGRRPFLPEKAEALGIPSGPWRRTLVDGNHVTLPDGRIITPDMVLGDFKPGTRLAIVGDAGETDNLIDFVSGADTLVTEATYLESESDMADRFSHLTAARSARFAKRAGVRQLILTHISRRYREKEVLQEAQEVFENVIVARDFDTVQVKREE